MFYLLKHLLLLILVIFKLKFNNLIFNKIMILNALYVCLHAFLLRRESPDLNPGRRTPHFCGGSITLVRVDTCGDFIFYHYHCGNKIMMMLSINIVAVLYGVLHVLSVVGLERRTIILIVCFICMIALVLNFACDKVVFLQIVLSLVTR
jgi:hypothetical protein